MRTILISFFLLRLLSAQSTAAADLAAGKVLVASRDLSDPNFARTVVLLVHYGQEGVLGLILNRQTEAPISRVFRELKDVRKDPVYEGGPVEKTVVLALLRSKTKPDETERVLPDVSLISKQALLEKTIAAGTEPNKLRVYLGYAGWTAKQLEMEVGVGAWLIFKGDAGMVFDPDPDSLWSRLMRRSEQRIAVWGQPFRLQPAFQPARRSRFELDATERRVETRRQPERLAPLLWSGAASDSKGLGPTFPLN